jgi:hypothetical protein
VFDTISVTFRLVPGPSELEQTTVVSAVVMDLLELDRELNITTVQSYATLDIWALHEAPVNLNFSDMLFSKMMES